MFHSVMFTKTKNHLLVTTLFVLLATAAQCGAQPAKPAIQTAQEAATQPETTEFSPANLSDNAKLQVVATTTIIGDMVRNVGGDMIDLTVMLPVGSDPHTFAPTPRDAASVADAHVIFVNGLNLEEFLDELIKNAGGKAPVVAVSTVVEDCGCDQEVKQSHAGQEDAQHDEEGRHNGVNPHFWMTPANAIIMVGNIEDALSALDPANAKTYQTNAGIYVSQLKELDAWVKEQIESIPVENRKLVTDHKALGYYVDRYGLELVGAVIPNYSANAEPSAQELAALQDAISQHNVKAIFIGTTANDVLPKRLAADTGIQVTLLYTGSLGQTGSGAETYIDFIRYNTRAIVEALK